MSRLSHVIIFTPEVERMRRFYQDRIGLAVAREGHGWAALRPAGAALWLHALGARHQQEIAIAFHVEDLDAAITALRAHGTDVTERENDAIFGRVAYFRDPDATLVDLQQYGAGNHQVVFDASRLGSGVYFYQLVASGASKEYRQIRKMAFVK